MAMRLCLLSVLLNVCLNFTCPEVGEPVPFLVSSSSTPDAITRIHKAIFSLPNYSLRLQREETHWAVAAAVDRHLGERVEPNPERLIAVRLVAGSTGSMPCNSDNHHKRHKDLGRRSTGRS